MNDQEYGVLLNPTRWLLIEHNLAELRRRAREAKWKTLGNRSGAASPDEIELLEDEYARFIETITQHAARGGKGGRQGNASRLSTIGLCDFQWAGDTGSGDSGRRRCRGNGRCAKTKCDQDGEAASRHD